MHAKGKGMVEDPNTAIGAAIRAHRERSGLSQTELARRMHGHGHTWHQTTVGRIEAGSRPLRLDEAAAAAGILDIPITSLLQPPSDDPAARAALDALGVKLGERTTDLLTAMQEHTAAETRMQVLKDSAEHERRRLTEVTEAIQTLKHAVDDADANRAKTAARVQDLRAEVEWLRAEVERHRGGR